MSGKPESGSDLVTGVIPKNDREEIRILSNEYCGVRRAHIRQYITSKNGAALESPAPTHRGIIFDLEHLPEVIDALVRLRDAERGEA